MQKRVSLGIFPIALILVACSEGIAPEDIAPGALAPLDGGASVPVITEASTADAGLQASDSAASSVIVTTVAGNGLLDVDGTGGAQGTAELTAPSAIAIDRHGNVYFVDAGDCVRKIDPAGNVTTLAGTGFQGDVDGPGAIAEFRGLAGIAVDRQDNVYVTDTGNFRIRRIDPSGNVTTFAGSGLQGESDGPPETASFGNPCGVGVDAEGNLYVADAVAASIRKVDPAGNVTTLAGNGIHGSVDGTGGRNGTAELWFPFGVAVDSEANVYVTQSDYQIRKIDPTGNVTTLPGVDAIPYGSGSAIYVPVGIAVDFLGYLHVTEESLESILLLDPSGNLVGMVGNGVAGYADGPGDSDGPAEFNGPCGVAVDAAGTVYVADSANNRIRKVDTQNDVTTLAGNGRGGDVDGTGGSNGTARLWEPSGITADLQSDLLVADYAGERIRRIDSTGAVTTLAGNGAAGDVDGSGGADGSAELAGPCAVATDSRGNVYVAEEIGERIRRIDPAGNVTTFAGNGIPGYVDGTGGPDGTAEFDTPAGLAIDVQDNVYVADFDNSRIRRIDPAGNVTTFAGNGTIGLADGTGGPDGTAEFYGPVGLAIDARGNLFVADHCNSDIRRVDPEGNVTTLASGLRLSGPQGIAVDPAGNVYVADTDLNQIVEIDAQGNFQILAGNGLAGYVDGPGGPAGVAELDSPIGLWADATGVLYVADALNNRIRKIVK